MPKDIDSRVLGFLAESKLLDTKASNSQEIEEKSMRRSIGRLARRAAPTRGGRRGRSGRRVLLDVRFDPRARDADGDGLVQDATRFERPAAPVSRMRMTVDDNGETDIEALLDSLERGRRTDAPQRLMGGDDRIEAPKPQRDSRGRDRLGLGRERSDVTEETYKGPKTIISAGKPQSTVIKGMSKREWDDMIDDVRSYFADQQQELGPKDKKLKALFQLMNALRQVKARDGDDGLELDGTDEYFKRIGTSLRAIKNQGNDDIRNLEIVRDAMRETRGGSPKRQTIVTPKLITINDGTVSGIKERDAKIGKAFIEGIEQRINSKFGEIQTSDDAFKAFQKSHPNIVVMFDFVSEGKTEQLTPRQRGLVYGYLEMFIDIPDLQKWDIAFERSSGHSAGAVFPGLSVEAGNTTKQYPRATMFISYTLDGVDNFMKKGRGRYQSMDGVPNQLALSYLKGNPDNLEDSELIDKSEFLLLSATSKHEQGHVVNYLRASNDSLGDVGLDWQKAIREKVKSGEISIEDSQLAVASLNVYNTIRGQSGKIDFLKAVKKSLIEDEIFISMAAKRLGRNATVLDALRYTNNNYDALWNDMYVKLNKFWSNKLTPEQVNSLSSDDREWYLLSKKFKDYFNGYFQKDELAYGRNWKKALKSRQAFDDFLSVEESNWQKMYQILNSDKYKDILKWRAKGATLKDLLEAEKSDSYINLDRDFHREVSTRIMMGVLRNYPDLVQELNKDILNSFYPDGYRKFSDNYSKPFSPPLALSSILSTKLLDDLTQAERATFLSWAKKLSIYGSKAKHSFYNNSSNSQPVEAVAETSAAIRAGILPDKGTEEWNTVKKLVTWMYGVEFWNRNTGDNE